MSRRQIFAVVLLLLSVGACAKDSSAIESGGETETETGEDATPMLPSAEGCTLELLWQASPNSPWIFAGVRSGGFLIAIADTEAETVALSRHDAAGELVWTVDSFGEPPVGGEGDLLELGDGRIVLVMPQVLSGWYGLIELYTATGQHEWWFDFEGSAWEVVGPQGNDGFACAGSFAWAWSDISGMSTCRYAGEGVNLQTAKEPETDRRIAALHGDDGRTWVVDNGCTVDELDSDTGLPTSWAACVGGEESSVHFRSLDRLAGGTLIAGGTLNTADDRRPYVHEFGADGEPLASWTGAEAGGVNDLAPLPDGGVLLAGTSALWRLDAQLELVAECRLTLAGEPWSGFLKRVAVDSHGRVLAELSGMDLAGVVRVEGLIE